MLCRRYNRWGCAVSDDRNFGTDSFTETTHTS